jgi:predicted MPP superfamily phosphohydrolase
VEVSLKRWQVGLLFQAVVAFSHGLVGLALSRVLPPVWFGAPLLLLWGATAHRVWSLFAGGRRSRWVVAWIDLPAVCHAVALIGALMAVTLAGLVASVSEFKRSEGWLERTVAAGYSIGALVGAWSIWGQRRRLRVRRVELSLVGLPASFDGYRLVHLSDLHIGDYESPERALGRIGLANTLSADLAVITGDLIARRGGREHEAVSVAGALRAQDGVLVVLGNHDHLQAERLTQELRAKQIAVLRNQWHSIERGHDRLWILGVDDWRSFPPDLKRAMAERGSAEPFVLLAHRYRESRSMAPFPIMLALFGHTHGGQIGLPWVGRWVNLMTLTGQRAQGVFRLNSGWGHVSAGLGTSGPPMRLGVDPEITLLVLRRAGTSMRAEPARPAATAPTRAHAE